MINGPQPVHVRDGMMGYMYVTYLMIERTGRQKASSDRQQQGGNNREGGREAVTGWTGGRQAETHWTGRKDTNTLGYGQESAYGAWYHVTAVHESIKPF